MSLGTALGMLAVGALTIVRIAASYAPDSILASTNLSGTVGDIDDDPDNPDTNWLTNSSETGAETSVRVSFPTPAEDLSGDQQFKAQVRKDGTSADPDCTIELWEAGTLVATLSTTTITSTSSQLITGGFSAADISDASDVECRLLGNEGNAVGQSVEVGAVEWNVNV